MNKITGFLDGLDLSKLVPELAELLGKVKSVAGWAVFLCPMLVLTLGVIYFFKPPKEANHGFGFRTYFGMGSIQAWRYTQRFAGLVYMGVGSILTIVMGIICLTFGGKDAALVLDRAVKCLIWEIVLIFAAWLTVVIHIALRYDKDGNRRKK